MTGTIRNRATRVLWQLGLLNAASAVRHPLRTVAVRRERMNAREWSKALWQPTEDLARRFDAELWREAEEFSTRIERAHRESFEAIREQFLVGGPGEYRLLYFLTRLLQPQTVVETGVAGGWSTAAILSAMDVNGRGHLWSSELVYTGRDWLTNDYERFVGYVVSPNLHARWTLLKEGDAVNLPKIIDQCGPIELFHYDSDKSKEGRERALRLIQPQLATEAPIVIDDINDCGHFREFVEACEMPATVVGDSAGVGLVWSRLVSTV